MIEIIEQLPRGSYRRGRASVDNSMQKIGDLPASSVLGGSRILVLEPSKKNKPVLCLSESNLTYPVHGVSNRSNVKTELKRLKELSYQSTEDLATYLESENAKPVVLYLSPELRNGRRK